jgi:hypothetical protein
MLLRDAIQQLAGTHLIDQVSVSMAEVTAVDEDARTCSCSLIGGVSTNETPIVALMAEVDDGMLLIPAVGSTVILIWSKRMLPFVVMCSELETVYITASNKIILNEGEYGGLVKVADLVDRLNNLESKWNELNTKVNTLAPTPVIVPIIPTTRGQIENTNVIHG